MEAVITAGYKPGEDIYFAMDAAASELYNTESGLYEFPREYATRQSKVHKNVDMKQQKITYDSLDANNEMLAIKRDSKQLVDYYSKIIDKFPVISIEDPLNEEDWDGWRDITDKLGNRVQLVGDDLFVTNTERLKKGIASGCANSILIKFNQIGTLSETIEAVKMAHKAGYTAISSHRSGETEDTTIADMAVALNMGQIKTGAPSRGERIAKYNRLLRIEDELGSSAVYPGIKAFNIKTEK